jgi:alpha-N-acetylglucosamine transferase
MSFVVEYLDLDQLPVKWFLGHKDSNSCYKAYIKKAREINYVSLQDVFDDLLEPVETLYPKDGMVVATKDGSRFGYAYGLHFGGMDYFMTEEGLCPFDIKPDNIYWKKP